MAGRTTRFLDLPEWDRGPIIGPRAAAKQDVFTESATQKYALGTQLVDGDRAYRYARCGATGLSKALMGQTQVVETKTQEIVQTGHAWAVGDISGTMLVTTGGTFADNEFAEGYLFANKVAAVGDVYKVLASKIQSADTIMDLELETPIRTAISVTTELSLIPNKYYDTVVMPQGGVTGTAIGVPLVDVTATYFYWAQTKGPCPLIVDTGETVVIGNSVGAPTAGYSVDGTCGVRVTLEQIWGNVLMVGAAAEPALINLTLD